ncbi:MAG: hypothetical protein HKO65_11880 [Gemmatimonadetes bacterium]|nr:hypothetical protein [Gemmatimonadota bacterium]NNM05778.1 hypothetical protein [Gemmatimonadota bacterium]
MNARLALNALIVLTLLAVGCGDDNGTPPIDTIRFGQLGEVEVGILAPLVVGSGSGELQQILTWGSSGAWLLREVISYRGLEGDETVEKNTGDPVAYASAYASLITQLNDKETVELFSISPQPPVPCAPTRTRVTVTIWDELRKEEATWVRCASGSLGTLQTSEAGPDLDALKVIQAAILVRDFTQGSEFVSTYVGSVPFGTLDKGETSGAGLQASREYFSVPAGNPNPPTGWLNFWADHNRTLPKDIPFVDWAEEMVIVAAVGTRTEAGDSVEVRRILQIGEGTQVFVHERIPGDFCSPAARNSNPIHIVVAPRTLQPTNFADLVQERVPCVE